MTEGFFISSLVVCALATKSMTVITLLTPVCGVVISKGRQVPVSLLLGIVEGRIIAVVERLVCFEVAVVLGVDAWDDVGGCTRLAIGGGQAVLVR